MKTYFLSDRVVLTFFMYFYLTKLQNDQRIVRHYLHYKKRQQQVENEPTDTYCVLPFLPL